jgi:hypothetical protein
MSNLKSELLQLTAGREKDLLAEIGRLSLQLRAVELHAHTMEAMVSGLEADGVIDHMGRKLPLPGHHADCEEIDKIDAAPSPLAESVTKAFQSAAADAVRTTLARGGTAVGEVQGQWKVVSKTCEHGNMECKKCGVGQPARDPHQDLKAGDHVRFEVPGVIVSRQSGGIIEDQDGNDLELVQYAVKDFINGKTYHLLYDKIINVDFVLCHKSDKHKHKEQS